MIYNKTFSTGNPSFDHWLLPYAAEAYARGAHQGAQQKRKYTGEPYVNHPFRCAQMAASFALGPVAVAGLWLHDVVEDTGVEIDEIRTVFGGQVGDLVEGLTNVYTKTADGVYDINPRSARHALSIEKLKQQPVLVKTCKMIDRLDNLRDILDFEDGVKFAKLYLGESRDVWHACAGSHYQLSNQLGKRLDELEDLLARRR